MTSVYFIRHAESYGNVARRAYGWYNGKVTPKGREQIACLEKRFENISVDAVYSSDLIRTQLTAEAICTPKHIQLHTTRDLREISLGVWEDRPWGELPSKYPEAFEHWCDTPNQFEVEGGETYAEVYARMHSKLLEIVRENEGKTVAIVSHGAALRSLMCGLEHGGDLSELGKCDWGDNTCVSLFTTEDGKSFTKVFKNDNEHLSAMAGFADNMRWTSEGKSLGGNVHFKYARYPDDRDRLRAYYSAAWAHVFGDNRCNMRHVDAAIRRVHSQGEKSIAFAYGETGEVGVIILDMHETVYPNAGHISLVYLKEEYRRRRYGIQLVGHAISTYRAMGKKHISVRAAESNASALAFYRKYGFYEAYREKDGRIRQIIMLLDI